MKKLILLLSLCTVCYLPFTILKAQNPNIKRTWHWYFGYGAGLDFSSGNPVPDTTGNLYTGEGAGAISDTTGNLLFYTDGDTVWNKNHQPMPNGTGLLGCPLGSSTETGIIIPKPGSNTIYYIFTTDCAEDSGSAGLRYSVVDMSLNSGSGDVITKNELLYAPSTEGLSATRTCDGTGYWLMSHEYNTNCWRAYKITNSGVDTVPVVSCLGVVFNQYPSFFKFSPDGSRISSPGGGIYLMEPVDLLFDFDNASGNVCNLIKLGGTYLGCYCSFSPDNTKLYFNIGGSSWTYQYDLSAGNDSASISNTFAIVDTSFYPLGPLSLAPNGKIYSVELTYDSLSTIHNPNAAGTACNMVRADVPLGGKTTYASLTYFVESFFGDTTVCKNCTEEIIENDVNNSINIFPNPASDFITIKMLDKNKFISEIIFIDAIGKETKPIIINRANNVDIAISNLNNGFYLLKVITENKSYITKIIINH